MTAKGEFLLNLRMPRIKSVSREWAPHVSLSVTMGVYSYWLASNRTWRPDYGYLKGHFTDTFYTKQAMAILRGRLDVSGATYSTDGECWIRAGKCFGYFGIFPSLIRLPFLLVLRSTSVSLSPLMIGIASATAIWALIDLLRHYMAGKFLAAINSTDRALILIVTSIMLGSASTLAHVAQSKIFRETALWVVALVLLTYSFVMRWRTTGSNTHLALAIAAAICATNTRPSAIPALIILGVWVFIRGSTHKGILTVNFLTLPAAFLMIPTASALAVYYLKFHKFIPTWDLYTNYGSTSMQRYLSLNNGQLQGLRFFPTNLAQYFRPDSLDYSLTSPWAHAVVPMEKAAIFLAPVISGGMYIEPVPSITNTMPIPMLLTVLAAAVLMMRSRPMDIPLVAESRILMLSGAGMTSLVLTAFANSGRYAADFLPLLAIGTIVGGTTAIRWLAQRNLLRPVLLALLVTGAYLTLVQFSLNAEGWNFAG